jgi:HSP20 family protein
MREEDVNVDIENNILTIRGEKREAHEEGAEEQRYHVWERRYGNFQRAFTLPSSVQADAIHAEFDAGILTVRMPKAPEAKGRTIEIAGKKKK